MTPPWNGSRLPDSGWRNSVSRSAWYRFTKGYDGLWLHRRLTAAGIENRVVDAASIPVERRSRRRKTDRIDLELLIRMLLALERGETRICRVIQVPTPAEEDAKRQHRERAVLVKEKTPWKERAA